MNLNKEYHGLKMHYLINKAGRAARYSRRHFHCYCKYIKQVKNDNGNIFNNKFYCGDITYCPPCQNLDDLMDDTQRQGLVKKYALNMPTLEELFIHLEDQIHEENDSKDPNQVIINTNNAEIPKLREVKKPSSLMQLLYLIKSRLKIFFSDKGFAFTSIVLPALVNGIMFIVIQKVFINKSDSTKRNIISIESMYNNTYFNLEPQSDLHFTQENWNSVLGDFTDSMLTHLPLNNITIPEAKDTYYVSSVNGKEINNDKPLLLRGFFVFIKYLYKNNGI